MHVANVNKRGKKMGFNIHSNIRRHIELQRNPQQIYFRDATDALSASCLTSIPLKMSTEAGVDVSASLILIMGCDRV